MNTNLQSPSEPFKSSQQRDSFFSIKNIGGFILLILIIGAIVIIADKQREVTKEEVVTKLADCSPLAQGKQIYNIFTDNQKNPQIKQVIFNPLDVGVGETQTITVKVLNSNADTITNDNKTSVIYHTDNKSTPVSLSMRRIDNVNNSIDIEPDGPDLLTTWEGTWINNDTNCTLFMASVTAASIFGESTVDVAFR